MRLKVGRFAATALMLAAMGVAFPTPAQAGDTWGNQNCTLAGWTETQGKIRCYVGSWRARARVDCYNGHGQILVRYGQYVDVGYSTANCPLGYEAFVVYAQYNQGPTIQLT